MRYQLSAKLHLPGRKEICMHKKSFVIAILLLIAVSTFQQSVASANGSNIGSPPPTCLTIIAGYQSDQYPTDEFCDADHAGNSRVDAIVNSKSGTTRHPGVHEQSNGADVEHISGDQVSYLKISLTNGGVIVKEVGKK